MQEAFREIRIIDQTPGRCVPEWVPIKAAALKSTEDAVVSYSAIPREFVWTTGKEGGSIEDHPFKATWSQSREEGGGTLDLVVTEWSHPVGIFGLVCFVHEPDFAENATLLDVFRFYDGRIVATNADPKLSLPRSELMNHRDSDFLSVLTGDFEKLLPLKDD